MKRLLLLPLLLMACVSTSTPADDAAEPFIRFAKEPITLQGGSTTINLEVEVAREPQQHSQGLMWRKSIDDIDGMLFVFKEEKIRYFWMRNTLVPLEIMYFDAEGFVVSTTTMEPCAADPCPNYSSVLPAQYALEVPAGWVEQQGVTKGWRLVL